MVRLRTDLQHASKENAFRCVGPDVRIADPLQRTIGAAYDGDCLHPKILRLEISDEFRQTGGCDLLNRLDRRLHGGHRLVPGKLHHLVVRLHCGRYRFIGQCQLLAMHEFG
ncbi:MAG: hypothetical protein DMF57_14005 [Acidobacteria bacterium]|nr:MAG: hypothetical protein DMF57_14005 [Acidobacteriota bacterium]